jgi:hypothetical protein
MIVNWLHDVGFKIVYIEWMNKIKISKYLLK